MRVRILVTLTLASLGGSLLLAPAQAKRAPAGPRYVGSAKCKECHGPAHAEWAKSPHGKAFAALAPGGGAKGRAAAKLDPNKDYRGDAKCVGCHTVGFGKPGGFELGAHAKGDPRGLLGVGCEDCHGPGGSYLVPGLHDEHLGAHRAERDAQLKAKGFVAKPKVETCKKCHNTKSPTFKPPFAGKPTGHGSFPPIVHPGKYAGTHDCKKCHYREYKSWKKTPHARAFDVLAPGANAPAKAMAGLDPSKDYRSDAKCVQCHVVGFGQPGGWTVDKLGQRDRDILLGVGCENCHGPGGNYLERGLHDRKLKDHLADRLPKMVAKGFIPKPKAIDCIRCHGPRSASFHKGAFDFEQMKAKGVHKHR